MLHPYRPFDLTRCVKCAFAVVLVASVAFGRTALATSSGQAPALAPSSSGTVVLVSTEAELQSAVRTAVSNTTIAIAPGKYELSSTLFLIGIDHVTLRGTTGNRNDVVLVGKGIANDRYENVPSGISTNGQLITIADLTIRDVFHHAIVFEAGAASPRVHNVRLVDSGQSFIVAGSESGQSGVGQGVVEYSVLEYTSSARDDRGGGVEVHTGAGWTIQHNLFRNIRAPLGQLAGPAVGFQDGSRNAIVAGNTFVNCQREVSMGSKERPSHDNAGGIVRNNFIYRSPDIQGEAAIMAADSPDTAIVHNTVVLNGAYASPIEYRYNGTERVFIANNLLDGRIQARDGAKASVSSNYRGALPSLFVNAAAGDLHLVPTATVAIDQASVLDIVRDDWDGDLRPQGRGADLGADELVVAKTPEAGAPSVGADAPLSTAGTTKNGPVALAAAASTLASPWSAGDIGSPALAGSAAFDAGVWTVVGSGSDIWGTSDQFQFAYESMTGDGEIVARVASLTNTNSWAKAGVMIRNTLSANSTHAFVAVTPANGVAFQRRRTTGGTSTHTAGAARTAPYWVRLVRAGSVFSGYSSADGATWTLVGTSTITMGSTVFVGLAVTSHRSSARATATFTNVSAALVTFTPSVDNDTQVTSYRIDTFVNGTNPASATPVASMDLGKPALVNGNMSADISRLLAPLPPGGYFATVVAIGPQGSTASAPSNSFTR